MSIKSTIKQNGSISAIRPKAISATVERTNAPSTKDTLETRIAAAVREAVLLLADGQWHPKNDVRKIAAENQLSLDTLLDYCLTAETRFYVCIPSDHTPEAAPDE